MFKEEHCPCPAEEIVEPSSDVDLAPFSAVSAKPKPHVVLLPFF